ncbi:MAG: PadR family transcriptional regulator [Vallitalea sp.]|jgi:DNA-binding PadR family transcriptional regulator|nr:PadR family transcriptional regulator [Vallitalea sp.]
MNNYVSKRLFQGFICLHILHHAKKKPFYGSWMLEELSEHGYKLSPGTLYPILHSLEKEGFIEHYDKNVNGKIRKYYIITEEGVNQLNESKKYVSELVAEIGL